MAFKANTTIVKGKKSKDNIPGTVSVNMTEQEYEFLLLTIKTSLFKGEYVEILYNLTLKLQEKYKVIKESNNGL